jgi:hypothetical protein
MDEIAMTPLFLANLHGNLLWPQTVDLARSCKLLV